MTADKYSIKSEEDAWNCLQALLEIQDDATDEQIPDVVFEGWPVLEIKTEKGNQEVGTQTMRGFLALQEAVWRSYLHHKTGERSLRRLDNTDRRDLELSVQVAAGSSKLNTSFSEVLESIGKKMVKKMSRRDLVIVLVSAGILFAGSFAWNVHVKHAAEIRLAEIDQETHKASLEALTQLSESHLEQLKIMERAYGEVPEVKIADSEAQEAMDQLLKSLPQDHNVTINDIEISSGVLQELNKTERQFSVEDTITRLYFIDKLQSIAGGFRIKIIDAQTTQTATVSVGEVLTNAEILTGLTTAFRTKEPILLTIDVRLRNLEITSGTIKKAEFPERE